jgi:hypothetical protein
MKGSNICPSCKFAHPQPITEQGDRFYCPKCKHVWIKGEEEKSLKDKGSMQFNGIMPAKQLITMITKNTDLPDAAISAFVAQFTGSLFEQWFEGFKAGLLADVVHKRSEDGNGETRSQQSGSDRVNPDGNRHTGEQHEQDGSSEQKARGVAKSLDRIKERVGGVEIVRPAKLQPTDTQYEKIAQTVNAIDKKKVSNVEFDGIHLKINYKL